MSDKLRKQFKAETSNPLKFDWTDDIGVMRCYAEWLEEKLTWRPASEKPENDTVVLALVNDCYDLVYRIGNDYYYAKDSRSLYDNENVLFWLPIPELPNEVKE